MYSRNLKNEANNDRFSQCTVGSNCTLICSVCVFLISFAVQILTETGSDESISRRLFWSHAEAVTLKKVTARRVR